MRSRPRPPTKLSSSSRCRRESSEAARVVGAPLKQHVTLGSPPGIRAPAPDAPVNLPVPTETGRDGTPPPYVTDPSPPASMTNDGWPAPGQITAPRSAPSRETTVACAGFRATDRQTGCTGVRWSSGSTPSCRPRAGAPGRQGRVHQPLVTIRESVPHRFPVICPGRRRPGR